jgi:hypothetical protein
MMLSVGAEELALATGLDPPARIRMKDTTTVKLSLIRSCMTASSHGSVGGFVQDG